MNESVTAPLAVLGQGSAAGRVDRSIVIAHDDGRESFGRGREVADDAGGLLRHLPQHVVAVQALGCR
jgi:hypothetical protein